ncbi:MAG TPA: hypothetical protein VGM03_00505 [Phycisphaerae bacterium]|jgi:hypothetical protein
MRSYRSGWAGAALVAIAAVLSNSAAADTFVTWTITGGSGVVQIGDTRVELAISQSNLEALSVGHEFRAITAGGATLAVVPSGTAATPRPMISYQLYTTPNTSVLLQGPEGLYAVEIYDAMFDSAAGQLVLDDAQLLQSNSDGSTSIVGTVSFALNAIVTNVQVSIDPAPITYDGDWPEICPNPSTGPDVIVGDLPSTGNFGTNGSGIYAYSAATTSCNIGNVTLNWISSTNQHPVIGQNLYRLKTVNGSGRFEQVGMSWLKHGFAALAGSLCCPCNNPGTQTLLGTGCSDPYCAGLNGQQSLLGPRSHVNASTGCYPYPFSNPSQSACGGGNNYIIPPAATATIGRRLQVAFADLDAAQNPGALYFIEGHYIAPDDAAAGNDNNNASYRRVAFSSTSLSIAAGSTTHQQSAAIVAWKDNDSGVNLANIDIPGDGRMTLGYRVTDLGGGQQHYEYALYNMNSHRSAQSFSIPVPAGVVITNIGFHDVSYHSGEPYSGADWTGGALDGGITWSTETYAQNVNANALRWGTLYNFRFDANTVPQAADATIGLFRPGTPTSMTVAAVGPSLSAGLVNIVSANPPAPAGNPYIPGQPYRDVLDTGTGAALSAGIGGAGTNPQGGINYAPISVTFTATPSPAPTPANITVACTGGICPTVTAVSGSGAGPYDISLSGVIPPLNCTTITFTGTNAGQKLQYTSAPGDVDLDGAASTLDLLWLVQQLNNGTANLPTNLARYNIDRSAGGGSQVNTGDLLRLVQLLNGTNTTQAFNGLTVAGCP